MILQNNIKILQKEIFIENNSFKLQKASEKVYIYSATKNGIQASKINFVPEFWVFIRKAVPLIDYKNGRLSETEYIEIFPTEESLGIWAWKFISYERALNKFELL